MPRSTKGSHKKKQAEPRKKKVEVEEDVSPENPDAEPFAVGSTLLVRWTPDGSARLCTVIERGVGRYYVHYHDFNRRMDEWIRSDRVLEKPSKAAARKQAEPPPAEEKEEFSGGNYGRGSGALDFGRKRKITSVEDMEHDEHEGLDEASLREHEEVTKVKNVGSVELGRFVIETWYFSPFPKEVYPEGFAECLYVCEHTFSFFRHKSELVRWSKRVKCRHPPGNEIYRSEGLAMFEVDGAQHTVFCQNLCYFAKLFLDHKTLYFDVDPFLFYVLTEYDEFGYHPVGYFSKEKRSEVGYNLACILTFPPYQRKGYGRFLIAFSYALSRKEGKVGAPEKPLSDLGHVSYRSYWAATLVDHFCNHRHHHHPKALSIMELSKATSIMADDVIATLQYLGLIRCVNGISVLWADDSILAKLRVRYPIKLPAVDPSQLHWTPYVHFENKRDKFSIKAKRPTTPENNNNNNPTTTTTTDHHHNNKVIEGYD
ncbi:hypothetical protein CTAYLR_006211 [Chrysophaeum taylorii]|uniref:histone acetyltransferase n=1 Tax=Chrysophaeum taylorii TaxID=2483200 RepID=A0AAD7U6Y2_9STRA|nr:hypothetical protein CTAYLR_006211 [Chrysophaeum taylorii]